MRCHGVWTLNNYLYLCNVSPSILLPSFRHTGIARNSLQSIVSQLDPLLQPWGVNRTIKKDDMALPYGTGDEKQTTVLKAYDALCKILRGLSDLPLDISTVQGLSPIFRLAEVGYSLVAVAQKIL